MCFEIIDKERQSQKIRQTFILNTFSLMKNTTISFLHMLLGQLSAQIAVEALVKLRTKTLDLECKCHFFGPDFPDPNLISRQGSDLLINSHCNLHFSCICTYQNVINLFMSAVCSTLCPHVVSQLQYSDHP